jgi:AraC-like DNA-binding protein
MDLDTECLPLGHIQTYFNIKKSIEYDADWLMKRAGISVSNPDDFMKTITGLDLAAIRERAGIVGSDEDVVGKFVSARQVLHIVAEVIEKLDMPYFGLPLGNIMTVSHHGMAGLAAVTQPTIWDCGQAVVRYCQELFPALEMNITLEEEYGWFSIDENVSLAPYTHFFIELNFVSFYNIFRDLAKHELPLANRLMAMTAEKSLFENIPTRAMRFLPLRVRRLLVRYYGAFPSLEKAATELGMSGRTMRRKLADDGTSYQQELDFVRQKFAREYFARGGESITELAHLLGFADSSAFAKAFRRWTDSSPREYLEKIRQSK